MKRYGLFQEPAQIEGQTGQEGRATLGRGCDKRQSAKFSRLQSKDLERVQVGINEPVFLNAKMLVALTFESMIAGGSAGREHFQNNIRRTLDVFFRDSSTAVGQHHDKIRFNDVCVTEHHIVWRREHGPDGVGFKVGHDVMMEPSDNELMAGHRRRGHKQISIYDFIPFSVVRQQQKVVIGQFRGRKIHANPQTVSITILDESARVNVLSGREET